MMQATGIEAQMSALGGVGHVVLDLTPDIGRYLFGADSARAITAVQKALGDITGTSDTDQQLQALADPEKAAALRVALARIAAEQAAAAAEKGHAALVAGLAGAGHSSAPAMPVASVAYGAPLVSMVVLLTFAVVVVVALTRTMPQGAEPVLNVLLGTLGAMATSVVGYWVGSSAGSARKEERLANLAERS